MAATAHRTASPALHPLHAVLLAATIPPFLGALLTDIAYAKTYHVQWTNFASWLVVGGLFFTALVLVFALVDLLRARQRTGRMLVYFGLVLALFVLGVVNSFVHAKDGWAAMPDGLVLSAVLTGLACLATWLGFARHRAGGVA